jgi:LmbE family N-acetylglucosaminyl deacetylase
MTTGDAGHQEIGRKELAERRIAESKASAAVIGAESLVLDNHDGELMPTLEVRKKVVELIRRFEADVVVTHRPNDYHPDHRYTAQAVQDAAYMVTVPHVVEEVLYLKKNPVFLYFMDRFKRPYPFTPDVGVIVDDAMDTKWAMLDTMESQIYEWLAWHAGKLDSVPHDPADRLKWMKKTWGPLFRDYAKTCTKATKKYYGKSKAEKAKYIEAFEISEYGHQPTPAEIRKIFPFLPARKSRS